MVTFIFLAGIPVLAQRGEFGVIGGASYYIGDVNPGMPFSNSSPAYGLLYRYNFSQRWAARTNLWKGNLHSSDITAGNSPEREWVFDATVYELSVLAEVNFLPYITGALNNIFSPYLFGGLAILLGNGTSNYGGYTLLSPAMPFGIGFKISLNKHFCLAGEWGYRKTLTDAIDNLPATWPNDSQFSNKTTNDWYSFAGLTLTYSLRLDDPKKCSDFINKYGY